MIEMLRGLKFKNGECEHLLGFLTQYGLHRKQIFLTGLFFGFVLGKNKTGEEMIAALPFLQTTLRRWRHRADPNETQREAGKGRFH